MTAPHEIAAEMAQRLLGDAVPAQIVVEVTARGSVKLTIDVQGKAKRQHEFKVA